MPFIGSLRALLVSKKIAPAGGGGGVALTFRSGPAAVIGASSPATFSSVPIGAASSDRIVAICVEGRKSGTVTLNINGSGATDSGVSFGDGSEYGNIFYGNITSGTTCTIDVILTGGSAFWNLCQIAVYTITGCQLTPTATGVTAWGVAATAPMTVTATVPSGGVGVAVITTDRQCSCTLTSGGTLDFLQAGSGADEEIYAISVRTAGSQTPTTSNAFTFYGAGMVCWGP